MSKQKWQNEMPTEGKMQFEEVALRNDKYTGINLQIKGLSPAHARLENKLKTKFIPLCQNLKAILTMMIKTL